MPFPARSLQTDLCNVTLSSIKFLYFIQEQDDWAMFFFIKDRLQKHKYCVVLRKSLLEEMRSSIKSSGYYRTDYKYHDGWQANYNRVGGFIYVRYFSNIE